MQSIVVDVLLKAGAVVGCILAYIMGRSSYCDGSLDDWYGITTKVISRSSMWSSDKTATLQVLLGNAPDGYYQSIIAIVNSDMWSSDKLEAIEKESAKFADTFII